MLRQELTDAFNAHFGCQRTCSQIRSALNNHKIKSGRRPGGNPGKRPRIYSPEQARFLLENYAGRSLAELTEIYNAQFNDSKTIRQIRSFVHNRGIVSGRTGRFEKGHQPWNSGTKGQGLTGANKGSFKNGNLPANKKRLWSERIDSKDGFVWISVPERNPYTGFPTRFKQKHVWVWECTYGPVPEGMVVAFKDGCRTNCDPSNLMLISRAELLYMNQHGYGDMPAELRDTFLAITKLDIKRFRLAREGAP
jgi:hypothetical protein